MKYLGGILTILIIAIIGTLFYLGAFNSVLIEGKEVGPYNIVYKQNIGDYSKVGPVMDEIYDSLKTEGINTTQGIGIYYDDPKTVETEKLRSDIGAIVDSEQDYETLIKGKKIRDLKNKYNYKRVIKKERAVAEFPYKNKMSIFVGMMKVYPAFNKYMEEYGYQANYVMEIYDMENKTITYVADIVVPTEE